VTDLAVPPCEQDTDLPTGRVVSLAGRRLGSVLDGNAISQRVLVLWDDRTWAEWCDVRELRAPAGPPGPEMPDCEDDGFGHHDADDALHDARREDDLR
jgi:hypothetical protein